jgi:hypothetical protein
LFFVVIVAGKITKLLVTIWVRGFVTPIRSLEMKLIFGLCRGQYWSVCRAARMEGVFPSPPRIGVYR